MPLLWMFLQEDNWRFDISGGAVAGVDYLNGRSQTVYTSKCKYDDAILQYGVPQGSVCGPRIFIEYVK